MAQQPDSTSFHQPLFAPSPPPLISPQFYHQQPAEQLFYQVNSHVITAVQAAGRKDARSVVLAYANIGVALGIDKACINLVRNYSKDFKVPPQNARRSLVKSTGLFKKDGADLAAMVSDVGVDEKIVHLKQFMRRRRIPAYVIETLHVPKRVVCDEEMLDDMLKVVDGLQDDSACESVGDKSVSLDIACQTVGESEKRATFCQISDDPLRLNVACQTENSQNESMRLDVACQTAVERSACRDAFCQTTGVFVSDKSSSKVIGKIVRKKHRGGRKYQLAKTNSGSASKPQSSEVVACERKIEKDEAFQNAEEMSAIENVDDEMKIDQQKVNDHQATFIEQSPTITSNDDDEDMPCKSIDWRTPIPITIDDSRTPGGGVMRQKDEPKNKRLVPYKIRRRLTSTRPPSNTQCTQLVINGLDPKMSIEEIHGFFCNLKSMECCSLKYDSSGKSSLGIATVAFADRVSAMKVLSHFENQMEDNFGVNMRLGATELSID